jgi:CBS domain-containing protein
VSEIKAPSDRRSTKRLGRTSATVSRAELRSERVRTVARARPAIVASGTPLHEALKRMRDAGGEAVLIRDDGQENLLGILTERDVLTRILGHDVDQARPVAELMTPAPDTLSADATLFEAMQMMESGGYRNLPLTDGGGRLVGLLRQQDLLEYVAEAFPQEILNLPPRPHQLMEEQEGA